MRCSHPDEQETKNVAFKSKYRNGTTCSTRCDIGYVIPTSQLPRSNIVCHAPTWNDSSIPECRRAMPPEQVSGCHNVTVAVGVGQTFQVEVHRLPSFVSEKGDPLTPSCELQGKKLPKGVHRNFCEATDKELRVTTVCTYYIEVEERRAPRPYLRDCKNRTLTATRRGTVKLKSPRFVVTRSRNSAKTFLHANCTYSGEIVPGTYINLCTAHDEATNSTGSCSYSVTVKERSCQPLPVIPHASLDCDLQLNGLYSPRTTCKYVCEEGFTIPKSQRRRRVRRCTSKLIWKPIMEPSCKRVSPPHPVRDACLSQTFVLKNNRTFVNLKPPKFKSSLKGSKVKVHCSLNKTLPAGTYINVCDAFDTELGISASCKYNVTVKNVECPLLEPVLRGSIKCDSETGSVPRVGALCNYECDEGYVIPTSLLPYATKLCTYLGRWNSTVSP
ncbi:Sushi repeat-containing protein SRPX2, partial [Stegodyphus mimosarum]